jgi:hypothetical protein
VDRTTALEEPVSPELVLVDDDLAARARAALPDPSRPQPAGAETTRPAAEVPPRRPHRRLRAIVVFGCLAVTLVVAVALAVEFVPRSSRPTVATGGGGPAAPAAPKTISPKQTLTRAKAHATVKRASAPKAQSKPLPTKKRSTPHASAPRRATKPTVRPAVKVERVFSWRRFRGAAYYQVSLRRGATPVYEARTPKRTASIRLELRPGRYHAVVRPAMPTDAGIVLGPAIVDTIVKV